MEPKTKKMIMGGVIFLFGVFLVLCAPIWTTGYFEMMLVMVVIGVAAIVIGLLVVIYTLVANSQNKNKIIKIK